MSVSTAALTAWLEPFFRSRVEKTLMIGTCVELERGRFTSASPKARTLAVAAPETLGDLNYREATVYLMSSDATRTPEIKRSLLILEMSKAAIDAERNNTSAGNQVTLENTTTGDRLVIKMESKIQKDILLSTVRNCFTKAKSSSYLDGSSEDENNDERGRGDRRRRRGVSSFLTQSREDVVLQSTEAREQRQREERRYVETSKAVLTSAEEREVAKKIRGLQQLEKSQADATATAAAGQHQQQATSNLLSIEKGAFSAFEQKLHTRLITTELRAAKRIIAEQHKWHDCVLHVSEFRDKLEMVEANINMYSAELLSRRGTIESIERDSAIRARTKTNLEIVCEKIRTLLQEMHLNRDYERMMEQFNDIEQDDDEQTVLFLADQNNARYITSAMQTIERILESKPQLETRYTAIDSIKMRCGDLEMSRLHIAVKIKAYLQYATDVFFEKMALESQRLSTRRRLVLLPPDPIFRVVDAMAPLIPAFKEENRPGHVAATRRIIRRLRERYAQDITRFFSELRRALCRSGWKGSPSTGSSLGSAEGATNEQVCYYTKSREFSPTPLMSPAPKFKAFLDTELKRLSAKKTTVKRTRDDDGDYEREEITEGSEREFEIILWPDNEAGVRLLKTGVDPAPFEDQTTTADKVSGRARGGGMRPDLAIAVALKATADLFLSTRKFFMKTLRLNSRPRQWRCHFVSSMVEGGGGGAASFDALPLDGAFDGGEDGETKTELAIDERGPPVIAAGLQPEGEAEAFFDDNDETRLRFHVHDEVNSSLWDAFASRETTNRSEPTVLHAELVRLSKEICKECDGLYTIPILSFLHVFLERINDGDRWSSESIAVRGAASGDAGADGPMSPTSITLAKIRNAGALGLNFDASAVELMLVNRGFLTSTLAMCYQLFSTSFLEFMATQSQTVSKSLKSYIKRHTLLPCFVMLPLLVGRLEAMFSVQEHPHYQFYERFLLDTTQQMFDGLDEITVLASMQQSTAPTTGPAGLPLGHAVDTAAGVLSSAGVASMALIAPKNVYLKQYLHHSLFTVFVGSCTLPITKQILRGRYELSVARRDKYRDLYIERILFQGGFPKFANFILTAEDVQKTFSRPSEMIGHNSLRKPKVQEVLDTLREEIEAGAEATATRLEKHISRTVPNADSTEDAFYRTILPVTWRRLSDHVVEKVEALESFINLCYPGELRLPLSKHETREIFAALAV